MFYHKQFHDCLYQFQISKQHVIVIKRALHTLHDCTITLPGTGEPQHMAAEGRQV